MLLQISNAILPLATAHATQRRNSSIRKWSEWIICLKMKVDSGDKSVSNRWLKPTAVPTFG